MRTQSAFASGCASEVPPSPAGRSAARAFVATLRLAVCVAGLLATACDGTPPATVERVAVRLGPEDFGRQPGPHGDVAQIGDDARPVVVAPARLPIALGLGLTAEDRQLRLGIVLPPEARDLPAGSFVVTVQRFPLVGRLPDSVFENFARTLFARQLDGGWQLERAADDPTRATVVYSPPEPDLTDRIGPVFFNLRVEALLPTPPTLESRPFEIPKDGHLELAYGLLNPTGAQDVEPVRFSATLVCGAERAELFARTVDPAAGAESGWHDERLPLPARTEACRLVLAATEESGGTPRGPVWTVPRVMEVTRGDARNLVLISLDTLRADHLSGYGYGRSTSPNIDAELIERGTTFLDLSSTFPQTDVAHLSLFTGLYGDAQPARGRLAAASPLPLLTERLRDAGFETAAFTEDALIAGSFGFWFGFDRFVERSFRERERGVATFADGIQYLRDHRDRRFFLFLHTYKTHDPYVAGETYEPLFRGPEEWQEGAPAPQVPPKNRPMVDAYDRTIREADDLVASLLAELAALRVEDRTIVVLLSDHGESFGEHGVPGHGFSGFREQLWIPLVLRGPGIPVDLRIAAPSSLVDVAPTLLDLLDLPPLPAAQGRSLAPALRGEALPEDRPLFFSWLQDGAVGVKRGPWKYLRSDLDPKIRVFDLASDPVERRALPPDNSFAPVAEELAAAHRSASEALRRRFTPDAPAGQPALTEEMERSLRSLGYIE